jgi:hypothetical protein
MKNPISYFQKYDPAMKIMTQEKADEYFYECVQHCMLTALEEGKILNMGEAAEIERQNLGYFAGYYSHETRLRVEQLFGCRHPVLPPASEGQLSPQEIIDRAFNYTRRN